MPRLLAWIKYADERLQFTRGLSAEDEPEAGCATTIWGSIYGLNSVCRTSAGLKRRVLSLRKWRYSPITSARRRFGGSKIRINARSLKISPSGIWMMNSWRS